MANFWGKIRNGTCCITRAVFGAVLLSLPFLPSELHGDGSQYTCSSGYLYTSCDQNYCLNGTRTGNACVACGSHSINAANNANTFCLCENGYTTNGDPVAADNSNTKPSCGSACSPILSTITLKKRDGTTFATIYTKYGSNPYTNSARTTQMTTSTNGVSLPTGVESVFTGFFDSQSGGTQMIDTGGHITAAGIAAASNIEVSGTIWYEQRENCDYRNSHQVYYGTTSCPTECDTGYVSRISPGTGSFSCSNEYMSCWCMPEYDVRAYINPGDGGGNASIDEIYGPIYYSRGIYLSNNEFVTYNSGYAVSIPTRSGYTFAGFTAGGTASRWGDTTHQLINANGYATSYGDFAGYNYDTYGGYYGVPLVLTTQWVQNCASGSEYTNSVNCSLSFTTDTTTNVTTPVYTTTCKPGYYGITNNGKYNAKCTACGGNEYYCPGGTTGRQSVTAGYYTTGGTSTTRTGQSACTAGNYCSSGVSYSCSTQTSSKYTNSAAQSTSINDCYLTTSAGSYVAEAGAGQVTCAAKNYCPGGSTIYKGGSVSGRSTTGGSTACPAANTYKRTTFPDNYYSPTITSTTLSSRAGLSTVTQCVVLTWMENARGGLYEYAYYNSTSGKYDTSSSYGWHKVNAGYYLTTKKGCGSYAYYGEAKPCPAGSYCPGKSTVECNSSNQSTVHTTNFGLNSCSSLGGGLYTNSAAGSDEATDCYISIAEKKYLASKDSTSVSDCPAGYYCTGGDFYYSSNATTQGLRYCAGRTKYSAAKSTSCSTVDSGYYTTGCNSSGDVCTGQAQCTGSTYCASGVQNNCPTADSGWTAGTGTGWTARTSCFEYQTPANCASGSVQRNGNSSANSYSSTITLRSTLTANNGYYASSTATSCSACPSLTSGYSYVSGTGWTAVTQCKEQMRPTNCYGGYLTKTANSSGAWQTAESTLTAKAGYKTSGTGDSATCSACGDGYYSGDGNGASCTACTTTSGWTTKTTSTTASAYTACYQTQTPSNCASGTIKRTASSISSGTITYGSASVTSALSANAGYYVNSTACSACGGNNYYCTGGTATRATVSSGYYSTGGDSNTRTGQSQCTGATYCSGGAKSNCPTGYDANTVAGKTANTQCQISVSGGHYIGTAGQTSSSWGTCGAAYYKEPHLVNYNSTSSCSSCPSGYTANTSTGKSAISSCQATCSAGNYIASGTYTQLEYLQSTGTQYINTGIVLDKMASELFVDYQKTTSDQNMSLMGCQHNAGNSGAYNLRQTYYFYGNVLLLYNATASSSSSIASADISRHTIHTTIDNSNNITVNIDGTSKSYKQTAVEDNTLSLFLFANNINGTALQRISAKVYEMWIKNASGELVFNAIPVRRNSDSVLGMLDLVSGAFFTNAGSGTFTAGPDVGVIGGTCSSAGTGYYAAARTIGYGSTAPRSQCPANYRTGAATDSQNNCSLTTTAKKYVATAGTGEADCVAGTYCAGGTTIYYGGTHSSTHMTTGGSTTCPAGSFCVAKVSAATACSSLSGVSPTGGTYTSAAGSTANTACKYTAPSKTITGCKTVTSQQVTYSGSAWPASTYGVTANKGYVIANNNKSNATCSICTGATYQDVDGSTATSCTGCPSGYTANTDNGKTANTQCQISVSGGHYIGEAGQTSSNWGTCANWTYKAAHSVNYGSTSSCDGTCPAAESGWTKGTGTGWSAVTSCYETKAAPNCKSGTLQKNAKNASEWNSSTVASALTANAGSYVNGQQCSSCGAGTYTSADNQKTACDACSGSTQYQDGTGKTSCKTVSNGYYKSSNSAQTQCPANYRDGSGASSQSGCTASCAAKSAITAVNGACTTQGTGYWAKAHTVTYGNTSVLNTDYAQCPANYRDGAVASAQSGCAASCSAGYAVLAQNGACTSIQNSTYKGKYIGANTVTYGNTSSISDCPTNYKAANGTTAQSNCETACSAGTQVASTNAACSTPTGNNWYTAAHNVKYGNTSGSTNVKSCKTGYTTANTGTATDHDAQGDCKISCGAGYYIPTAGGGCVACTGGKYCSGASNIAETATSAVTGSITAGYFCAGGAKTATPTSSSDSVTSASCGKCTSDSTTGRQTYSGAGASSCSICPEVTGTLVGRVKEYSGWWGASGSAHNSVTGCFVTFTDSDDDATYETFCYYNTTDAAYGGTNSQCYSRQPTACAAGKYNTITSTSEWVGASTEAASCKGVDCMKGKVCTTTDAGKYSAEGSTAQANVTAGYYCSGGCKTATPTSSSDCLSGNTCGKCGTDSTTGRPAYSNAGASSCTACPAVSSSSLSSRVTGYSGWWNSSNTHDSITGCNATFTDSDDDATFRISCWYNSTDADYGGAHSYCQVYPANVTACAAGKYKTIESSNIWYSSGGYATCSTGADCANGKVCTNTTAGYYSPTNDLTQTQCPAGYPNSASGSDAITDCYSGTKSRAWTGSAVNGTTPTGCTVTAWNSCSNSACDYVAYANAAGTGDGTIKSGCSTNSANCTKTVKTVSANNGYYAASNATSCTACPTLTSGYSYVSGTGWNTYSQCKETKSDAACASGALTKTADSASTWATAVSTLSAGSNKYVTGSGDSTTCTSCPSGYPNSAGGTSGVTQCYSNSKSRAWTGSQTECTNPDTTGCSGFTCGTCSGNACTYTAYANSTGDGDGTVKTGCSTNNAACQKPVATLTAKANYYVNGTTSCPTCTSKNSSYPNSDGGNIGYGKCYTNVTRGCTKNNGATPTNCYSVTAYSDCSCTGETYKSFADSTTSGTTTDEVCTKNPSAVTASSGYYVSGTSCVACTGVGSGFYPNSNDNNTGGASACYTDEISGKYVAANATSATNCAAGSYKGTHTVNYGSSSSCSVCDSNKYSNAGASSCSSCATTNGYGNSGSTATDHAGVTSCTVNCPGGSYVATSGGACVDVTAGYYKAAHTVAQTQTSTRGQCATGLTTIGYGAGADEAGDCGRVLHAGTGELYLRSDKKGDKALNVKIGGTTYYGNMSTTEKVMSDGQTEKLKVKDNGTTYFIHDDSVGGG